MALFKVSSDSPLGKEMAKWNKPYKYEHFPILLYKGYKREDGRIMPPDVEQPGRCLLEVGNEDELHRALEAGWRESPAEAVAFIQAKDEALSTAAAHRAYEERNMSEGAKDEIAKAEASTPEHLGEIPEKPVRRRGRPKKVA